VEEGLHAEVVAPGIVVMPLRGEVMNWQGGTVQGGIQACLAELAAERARPGPHEVTALSIRYLNRVEVDPVRAVATSLADDPDAPVRVELLDDGVDGRLVAHVLATTRPVLA
jgi:acyl-coenzyme A thioesterase PaaI-like protein